MGAVFAFLTALTSLAGPIANVAGKIEDTKIALAKAQTDDERNRLNAEIAELHDRHAVLLAEANQRIAGTLNACLRGFIAIGPASYIAKYYLWDKVVGAFAGCVGKLPPAEQAQCRIFTTDGLTAQMAAVMTAVVAFYFVYDLTARFRK